MGTATSARTGVLRTEKNFPYVPVRRRTESTKESVSSGRRVCCSVKRTIPTMDPIGGPQVCLPAPHCDLIRLPFAGEFAVSGPTVLHNHVHHTRAWGTGTPHPPARTTRSPAALAQALHAYLQTLFARFPAQVIDISMGRRYFLFIAGWLGAEHSVFPYASVARLMAAMRAPGP